MIKYIKQAVFIFIFLLNALPAFSIMGPTLIMDTAEKDSRQTVFGLGPMLKYKHIDGFTHFKGDMGLAGFRAWVGRMRDPEFGVMHVWGDIRNDGYKMDLKLTGLTIEDSFKSDPRVKWRVTAGWGEYNYIRRWSGQSEKKSRFGFCEPQIIGVLPMSRNVMLEFGVGWTIADTSDVRMDGVALNAELLFGKF